MLKGSEYQIYCSKMRKKIQTAIDAIATGKVKRTSEATAATVSIFDN